VAEWLPELDNRRVLISPMAALEDIVPARRAITLRHLLTNASGYGMSMTDSPLLRAMAENGTEAGAEPLMLGVDEWVARLAELPLAFHPGEGWRYHHSFGLLGILLARLTGRRLDEHLAEDLFVPLGMIDTDFSVPEDKLDRLPAAYRHSENGLVETEPAGGGFYAGPPPFDMSHGELVSTVADFHRFIRLLADGGRVDEEALLSAEHLQQMTSDQMPAENKPPTASFRASGTGWVGDSASGCRRRDRSKVGTAGPADRAPTSSSTRTGPSASCSPRWSLGEPMSPLLAAFQALHQPT
jgi:CubicO group peptidase (beta-lactamase class C family)